MGLSDLLDRAKGLMQKRGGSDAAKEDAQEVKDVARSDASTSDKMKEGAEALKDPGAKGPAPGTEEPGAGAQDPAAGTQEPGAGPKGPRP